MLLCFVFRLPSCGVTCPPPPVTTLPRYIEKDFTQEYNTHEYRMKKSDFIDREREQGVLQGAWERPDAQLLVLYGRRRVGKTALLQRFSRDLPGIHYVATRLPEQQQLLEMGRALGAAVGDPLLSSSGFRGWEEVFLWLEHVPRRIAFILDEYPYLVEANRALSSLWQRAWDRRLSERTESFVILCGSSIAMMEQETLDVRSPLYGRRTGQLRLQPLPFEHARKFVPGYGFEDQVRTFAAIGGVPYYLRLFDSERSLRHNIRNRILEMGAPLREEVEFLLRQELREPRIYFGILSAVAAGKRKLGEILGATGLTAATVGKYLSVLQDLGFVSREVPLTQPRPEKSKRGLYRIEDPFVRFWFRFVLPQRGLLETGRVDEALHQVRKDLDHFTGETYEEICREAVRSGLLDEAGRNRWDRVGRWWVRTAEIDILSFSEDHGAVLVGEVKWSRKQVGVNILAKLEASAELLPVKPDIRRVYVLFSRSGFTRALQVLVESRRDVILVKGLQVISG